MSPKILLTEMRSLIYKIIEFLFPKEMSISILSWRFHRISKKNMGFLRQQFLEKEAQYDH